MRHNKKQLQHLALIRVKELFKEAQHMHQTHPQLADRYVQIARRTAMKVNLKLPREFKRRFCKHCYAFFVPSKNCRIRIHKSRVVYYCFSCKKYMRFMLKGEEKIK